MSLEIYLRHIPLIKAIFSELSDGDAEWIITDKEKVLFTTAQVDQAFGLGTGMLTFDNPMIREVLERKARIVLRQKGWRDDPDLVSNIIGAPIKDEYGEIQGVFLYAMAIQSQQLEPESVLQLLQEMYRENDLEAGLKALTRRSLELFQATMAGIWLLKDDAFQPLAISADTPESEGFLDQTEVADILYSFSKPQIPMCTDKLVFHDISHNSGLNDNYFEGCEILKGFGVQCFLCVPLMHFGQLLGVLALFSREKKFFDDDVTYWLQHLMPLLSTFVDEHQMRLEALEREQALTLLLRGTEILVQADSEERLLTEAGEMAMEILYLEAGFFIIQEQGDWLLCAPFGRLKQCVTKWQDWAINLMNKDSSLGYVPHLETTLLPLQSLPEDKDFFPWQKVLIQPIQTHQGVVGELWLLDSQNTGLKLHQEILAAFARVLGVALETIRQRNELERLASTDRLTEILNRQGFEQRIREEISRCLRNHSTFLLLLLDLDGFKKLNDTEGHPVGDMALRYLAQHLRSSVREQDIVARTGGDEFCVVLTDIYKCTEAIRIIERLKNNMGLESYHLGVSIGVAEFPTEARDYEGLYRLADSRLYQGKNSGKGKIITGQQES